MLALVTLPSPCRLTATRHSLALGVTMQTNIVIREFRLRYSFQVGNLAASRNEFNEFFTLLLEEIHEPF